MNKNMMIRIGYILQTIVFYASPSIIALNMELIYKVTSRDSDILSSSILTGLVMLIIIRIIEKFLIAKNSNKNPIYYKFIPFLLAVGILYIQMLFKTGFLEGIFEFLSLITIVVVTILNIILELIIQKINCKKELV